MPHVFIEHSSNLAQFFKDEVLVAELHTAMCKCETVTPAAVKTRTYSSDHFRVGTSEKKRGFIHVTVSILEGRTPEVKKQMGERLLATLTGYAEKFILPKLPTSISLELRDMAKAGYYKND